MPRVMSTTLRGASGGFGEYDWVECSEIEGAEDLMDYESMCRENDLIAIRTDELDGQIHNQRGVVYKFAQSYEVGGELIEDWHYEMVWIEDEEGGN
jgi:hypothetical protein